MPLILVPGVKRLMQHNKSLNVTTFFMVEWLI